jgi:branched-chain amino acid transport system permease protein
VTLVLTNGIVVGSVYAIFALGLVLVYKGSRVVNFAQGEFGMFGAFVLFALHAERGMSLWIALPAALASSAVLGALTELLVMRRLVRRGPVIAFVATLGIGTFLILAVEDIFDPGLRYFPPLIAGDALSVGGLFVTRQQALAVGVATLVAVVTSIVYTRTPLGLRMRASAQNPFGAVFVGVNVDAMSTLTWAVGGLLAGLAAVLIAPLVTFQVFFMTFLLARALAASIVGGMTSLVGAYVGGITLGLLESAVTRYSPISGSVEAGLFGIVLVMLLIRPRGLLGAEY